jgi:eukaryotic-like serine/threonine-protein kinase
MFPTGQRFGAYEVLAPLGAGGMGEVYRAHDGNLGRHVALKVLPDAVSGNPQRLARFEREAKLLAMLDHPGIASIHALEYVDRVPVLVLELVEGRTLTERLHEGPLPIPEALEIGRQIADALEAAHERGIIHRDLKPSNVMVTPQRRVKLLDFGLAKALAADTSADLVSKNSTETPPTSPGAVVGTEPYMSPEQARGQDMDKRTDVWSFGCVLYELLTGRRAFDGASRADVVAAILDREPDWTVLPPETPASVRRLLRRCLQKDRVQRLHDVGDVRLELGDALGESAVPAATRSRWAPVSRSASVVIAVTLGLLTLLALPGTKRDMTTPTRLTVIPPSGISIPLADVGQQLLAISPTGDRVAFKGWSSAGGALFIRKVGDVEAHPIPGTLGADTPFFSPDGRWLAFSHGGQIRRVPADGGPPVHVADVPIVNRASRPTQLRGATWGPDGTIVFAPEAYTGLWRVSADGGTTRRITQPDSEKGETSHRWPQILPGGHAVLFTVGTQSWRSRDARIEVLSLSTGERHVLVEGSAFARYSPTGHLIHARLGTLAAVPFDAERLRVTGSAVTVLDGVQMALQGGLYASFDLSAAGDLAYVPGHVRPVDRSLLWVDRSGNAQPLTVARRNYVRPRVSPDGRQLLVSVMGEESIDVWRMDLAGGAWTRMTSDGDSRAAEWAPDGRSIGFLRTGGTEVEVQRMAADGSAGASSVARFPRSRPVDLHGWSSDSRLFVFHQQTPTGDWDIGVLLVEGGRRRFLLDAPYLECCAALSPDGHWMAYVSRETGFFEVYVRAFKGPGERRPVSAGAGIQPRWSRDGSELFYRTLSDRPKVMAVAVKTRGGFRAGTSRPLFDDVFAHVSHDVGTDYDVAPDGRFVFLEDPPIAAPPRQLVLIPGWSRELEDKLRTARP